MKTRYSLLGIVVLSFFFNACNDGIDPDLLIGKWQAIALTAQSEPVDLDLSPVYFEFSKDQQYHFQSTLKFSESGRYYTQGRLLYTTDTTADNRLEKAVKIIQLNTDSLGFLMNDQGVEKELRLLRMKE